MGESGTIDPLIANACSDLTTKLPWLKRNIFCSSFELVWRWFGMFLAGVNGISRLCC